MADYKHPEVLVSTEWVANNLNAPNTRLVEVDVDTSAYDQGHIPGAVGWNWQTQLQDNVRRDLISKEALEALLSKSGISNDTTILLYGDNNNWFAAYAFLAIEISRTQRCEAHQRRPQEMAGRKTRIDDGSGESDGDFVQSRRAG
jgi:3-mercaptopyruvate sulfurtransferase SseA